MTLATTAPETLVAVSLETTGLNPLHYGITEVGAVRFDYEGKLLDTFWERVNPGIPVSENITKLTGIHDDTLVGARRPEAVVQDFFAWAGPDAWFAAHSGEFEAGFLRIALGEELDAEGYLPVLSTLQWARSLELGVQNCRLGTLMDLIDFDIRIQQPFHGTLVSTQAVADLVWFLLNRCYADPSYEGVKDILSLRMESLHVLAKRSTGEWRRQRRT